MPQTEYNSNLNRRFMVALPVLAEWDEEGTGRHVVAEGTTEHVGPSGALVTLPQMPSVGSNIKISVKVAEGPQVEANAEVLRLVRDVQHPLVSLNVKDAAEAWRGHIWEPAGILAARANAENDDDDFEN